MNINVKPSKSKPFQRRKPPMLPAATSSPETFIRFVVAKYQALLEGRDALAIANGRWPADSRLRTVLRAASEPPYDPANTPALAAVMTSDFVAALQPYSAAAQLFNAGLLLHFDRYAKISVPDFVGLDDLPPPWVAAGQPAPVGELTAQAATIEPRKLEFIVTLTRDMVLGSNAEKLVGDALKRAVAFGLDKALFDDRPGDAARPPGLRSFGNRIAESTAMNNETAMMMDVGALVGAAEHIAAGSGFYFVGRSRRISAMRMMMRQVPPNFTLLPSAAGLALPESALICVVPSALAAAVGLPEIEIVEAATLHMDDAPEAPDEITRAPRVRSLFQTDTLGMKLRLPASWTLRVPEGANWITCLWPSDIGGGGEGLPEAPFDEFSYGRHQGGWSSVVEEAPSDPPSKAWVRGSTNTRGWHLLEDLTNHLAPTHNPTFTGTPRASQPVATDASDRIATTQFVKDNVESAGGGGIEDVPSVPLLTVHGRMRVDAANTTWSPITGVFAPLISPAFTGIPTAPNPPAADSTNRIATTQFVKDNFYVSEAPDDANHYARSNRVWRPLEPVFARIASPAFTGTPTAPNPPASENSTRLATTAYVKTQIAPPLLFEAIADIPIPGGASGDGTWVSAGTINFSIPRGGNSRIRVTVSGVFINAAPSNFTVIGVRMGTIVQRNAWTYGLTSPCSFHVDLIADVVGDSINVPIQFASLLASGGASNPFTVRGGMGSPADRLQILITDLGPR